MHKIYAYEWLIQNLLHSNNLELVMRVWGTYYCFFVDSCGELDVRILTETNSVVEYTTPEHIHAPRMVRVYSKVVDPVTYRAMLYECASACFQSSRARLLFRNRPIRRNLWLIRTMGIPHRIEIDTSWTRLNTRHHRHHLM